MLLRSATVALRLLSKSELTNESVITKYNCRLISKHNCLRDSLYIPERVVMGNIMAGIPLTPAHLCLGRPSRFPAKIAVTSRVMRALASRPPRKEQERVAAVMCDVNKLGHSLVRADVALEATSWLRCEICDILAAVCNVCTALQSTLKNFAENQQSTRGGAVAMSSSGICDAQ